MNLHTQANWMIIDILLSQIDHSPYKKLLELFYHRLIKEARCQTNSMISQTNGRFMFKILIMPRNLCLLPYSQINAIKKEKHDKMFQGLSNTLLFVFKARNI